MSAYRAARPIFITEIEQFGGAERSLLALSSWLYRKGYEHYLLTYFDHCNIAQNATHPIEVVALNPQPSARKKIAALRAHFAERGESAYHPLLSGYQPALHSTLAGIRGFHTLMHDTPVLFDGGKRPDFKGRVRQAVSNRISGYGLRSGGTTIVTSEFLRDDCRKLFGVDAAIARMGGLVATEPLRVRPVEGTLKMLSVCRIEGNKRLDWILRALGALENCATPLSARVDWRLDLAGKGSQIAALQAMAESLGIAGRVKFHGFVSDDELKVLFDEAHLFLMPALQGYGIPAIEAMQRGIPVLLHRESGVSDILLETPWAIVLYGDESAMLGAMQRALDTVIDGRHIGVEPPSLPTEDGWAERVAGLCGWD